MIPPSYKRPPITEAVVEFRFQDPVDERVVEKVSARVAERYPAKETIRGFDIQINPDDPPATRASPTFVGQKRTNLDGTGIVIVATTHLTTSVLAPYPGWDAFQAIVRDNWNICKTILKYRKLSRVGIRYINRIDIPLLTNSSAFRVSDYLMVFPSYPEDDLPPVEGFTLQLATRLATIASSLVINVASVPSPLIDHASVLFDIDIGRQDDVPQNERDLWKFVDSVRLIKNRVFESAITDMSRELFNR
jgi:uncharacterized protein (TIGR04255 family)